MKKVDSQSDCKDYGTDYVFEPSDEETTRAAINRARGRTKAGCAQQKRKQRAHRRIISPPENTKEDSDSGIEIVDEATFRKAKAKAESIPGPSTNNRYEGESDDDTDSDVWTDRPSVAPAKQPFTRKNGGSSAGKSTHLRANDIRGKKVNDNIIACPNEENTGVASRTKAKKMKTGESDDDTDSDGPNYVWTDKPSIAPAKHPLIRKNGGSSAGKSTQLRANDIRGKKVNDNIIACPNEENTCVASRTRAKKMKTGEIGKDVSQVKIPELHEKEAPEENGENYIILSDNATSGEELPANNNVEREVDEAIAGNEEMPATLGNEEIPAAGEVEKPVKKKLSSLPRDGLFRGLADSVLGRGPLIESESENEEESTQVPTDTLLPKKFWFYDSPKKVVEKTASEEELAADWEEATLAVNWMQGSSNLPEVNSEPKCSSADNTPEARCARKEHETVQDEENGVYCIYCGVVVVAPEDILPEWADKNRRRTAQKRPGNTEKLPESVDTRHVQPSSRVEGPLVKKTATFTCPDNGTVLDLIPGERQMYIHQREGFEFLWKNLAGSTDIVEVKSMAKPKEVGGCIISHAPGTGKTRLTIVFLETYLKVFPDSRPVIIAPASMLLTWKEELRTWKFPFPVHNLNSPEFTGDESKSAANSVWGPKSETKDIVRMVKLYSWDRGGSVLLISYSLFEKLTSQKQVKPASATMGEILLEKPGLVILDEGHTARNELSNLWNALFKLKTEKRVILSGTPFQNNFTELFNILKLVRPAVAKDKTLFKIDTSSKKRKGNQSAPISETIDAAELEKLKSAMLPFVNIHKGTKLNGLGESVILLKPPELQERLIKTIEGQNRLGIAHAHKVALTSVHPNLLLHCKKSENQSPDISLLEASRHDPNEGAKTKFIIEFSRLSVAAKEKVLIFSQFIAPLELIKEQLMKVFKWVEGKHILLMEGKQDQKVRQNLINSFNEPSSEAKVMLASITCCSEGISLVGASRVVLLDVVWNPSVERQAISRAFRIGQTKFVHAYHLLTSGTSECDKYCKQADKEHISELVFGSSNAESDKGKKEASGCIDKDTILEQMSKTMADMFVKIIHQPKGKDIFQNFGLTENPNEA